MKGKFKLKHLVSFLSDVEPFKDPKWKLEQYCTTPEVTAGMFDEIGNIDDNILGKIVGDFCCGTAAYCIAASYFEPAQIIGIDIDQDALDTATENIEHYELEDEVMLMQGDIIEKLYQPKSGQEKKVDLK